MVAEGGKWVDLACSLFTRFGEKEFKSLYLDRVAEIIPARAYGFYLFRASSLEPYDLVVSGVPQKFVKLYESVRAYDLVFLSALRSKRPYHSDMLSEGVWAGDPAYKLLAEYGIPRCMDCPIISLDSSRPLGVVNIARGELDARFTQEDVDRASLISRLTGAALDHLAKALRPEVMGRIIEVFRDSAAAPASELLTRRELDVALCVARGLTNSEICQVLHISNNTVRMHLKHVFKKLGIRNRTELAAHIIRDEMDGGVPDSRHPPGPKH